MGALSHLIFYPSTSLKDWELLNLSKSVYANETIKGRLLGKHMPQRSFKDKAMTHVNNNVGGIDFRTEGWDLKIIKDYQTQMKNTFEFDPNSIHIDGLTPLIINIQAINIGQMLGLENMQDIDSDQLTYNRQSTK